MKSIQFTNRESLGGSALIYLILGAFPLIVTNGYANLTSTKMVSYLLFLSVSILILAFKGPFKTKYNPRSSGAQWVPTSWSWRLPDLLVLSFLVSCIIAWFASPYFSQSTSEGYNVVLFGASRYDGLFYWASYMLIYFFASRYARLEKSHLTFFAAITLGICLISIVQLFGINALGLYPLSAYPGWHNHFFGTIGNTNMMASFLCMAIPLITVGYIVFQWQKSTNWFLLITSGVMVYVLLWLQVDMGIVGLLAVIAVITPLLLRNKQYTQKTVNIGIAFAAAWMCTDTIVFEYEGQPATIITTGFGTTFCIGLVLLLVLIAIRWMLAHCSWANTIRYSRLAWTFAGMEILALVLLFVGLRFVIDPPTHNGLTKDLYELVRGQLSDTAGHNRVGTWRCAFAMAMENFWFGTGNGTFPLTFKEFAKEFGYTRYANQNLDFAHNDYLHLFCTTGFLGVFSYVAFLCSCAWQGLKQVARNPRILLFGGAMLGYSVQSFFSFSIVVITPVFWLILGLLIGETRETLTNKQIKEMISFE